MVIFHSYVSLPEGSRGYMVVCCSLPKNADVCSPNMTWDGTYPRWPAKKTVNICQSVLGRQKQHCSHWFFCCVCIHEENWDRPVLVSLYRFMGTMVPWSQGSHQQVQWNHYCYNSMMKGMPRPEGMEMVWDTKNALCSEDGLRFHVRWARSTFVLTYI